MSTQVFLEIWVLVSWATAFWAIGSSWIRRRDEYAAIGRRKRGWAWFSLAGLIPYVGIITALIYLVAVRAHFERDEPDAPTLPGPRPQPVRTKLVDCTRCNRASGWVTCEGCGGNWKRRNEIHGGCGCQGGRKRCRACDGSGKVTVPV